MLLMDEQTRMKGSENYDSDDDGEDEEVEDMDDVADEVSVRSCWPTP